MRSAHRIVIGLHVLAAGVTILVASCSPECQTTLTCGDPPDEDEEVGEPLDAGDGGSDAPDVDSDAPDADSGAGGG
jgi:hypothetical protein